MKKQKLSLKSFPKTHLGDGPTPEWHQHNLGKAEEFDPRNRGKKRIRNYTCSMIKRYHVRGQLSEIPEESARMLEAGELFYSDGYMTGMDSLAMIRHDVCRVDCLGQDEVFSERRAAATKRFRDACKELGPCLREVLDCVCFDQPLGRGNMGLLRRGLECLVNFYKV